MVQNRFEKMRQTEYEKGIIFGVQQGVQQGMQQGVQQGMQQSLQILESLYSNGTLSIKDVREQAQKLMGKGCDSLVEKFLISLK